MLKLYDYYRSSASFRVRIALNLKGLKYEEIPIHLVKDGGYQFREEYKNINPQSLVPTLEDNKKIINQSIAIIEYLDETYPAPFLLPRDPYQKALARAFAFEIAADIHPLNNLRVLTYLNKDLNIQEKERKQWYHHWIALGFSALEKKLATTKHTSNFCFGAEPTLADICLVPQMYNARRFECDLSSYPILTGIDAYCQTHPAFIEAWPKEKE